MKSIVIYATRTGNTGRVAAAIATVLSAYGDVELQTADQVDGTLPPADLVVVGSPTEGHGVHPALASLLDRLGPAGFAGRAFAAFDTRVAWPHWLSGSAASKIRQRAEKAGGRLIGPEHSCIVSMKPELEAGEMERVTAWAQEVAGTITRAPVAATG